MKETETELKFRLDKERYEEFRKLATKETLLVNDYFFPEKGDSSGFTLRIREEDGTYTLTRKTKKAQYGNLTVSREENVPLTPEKAAIFLKNGISSEELSLLFGTTEAPNCYNRLGSLKTLRAKVILAGAECDLDKCDYLGTTDYELECEDSQKHAELSDFLAKKGITEPSEGKRRRFEERLKLCGKKNEPRKETKMTDSTMYRMMRMSELSEEDGLSEEEAEEIYRENHPKKDFKEEYKEFYTDIKISVKEDW